MKFILLSGISIFFILLYGCSDEQKNNLTEKNNSINNYVVDTLNAGQLNEIINNRNGKILFINFWATWCVPCVEEFPDIVKLAESYKEKDVEFLSLSVDLVKEINSAVIPFLQKQKVNFPVFVIPEKESEKVINRVQPDWNGAIPATAVYNREGKLVSFITGLATFDKFKQKVDEALKM